MNTNDLERAKQILTTQMPHVPKAQILHELGVVLERLHFMPNVAEILQSADSMQVQSSLSFLLQQDVSSSMYQGLTDLQEQGLGNVLIDAEGEQFFQFCREYFESLAEVRVVTAVKLSDNFERQLALQLNRDNTQAIRVVFEVLPTIIGGCMIIDANGRTTDYSFKTNISFYAHRFLSRKLQEIRP